MKEFFSQTALGIILGVIVVLSGAGFYYLGSYAYEQQASAKLFQERTQQLSFELMQTRQDLRLCEIKAPEIETLIVERTIEIPVDSQELIDKYDELMTENLNLREALKACNLRQ